MKIDNTIPLRIFVNNNGFKSIDYAVKSLVNDLTHLFVKPMLTTTKDNSDIVIDISPLEHKEEYEYIISDNKVTILGNDDLGVIFGIYAFLENELKVPPFYKIEGLKLYNLKSIELSNKHIRDYPKCKFRGWFINDEDLLSGYQNKGKRNIDYEYYVDIISPRLMENIAETILRYRFNLIIPSTLIDLTNSYEARLVSICSKRGLYISQHHIEPLGVSKYGFESFCKKYQLDDTYSYISNMKIFEKCWKFYAKKWNKYPRIIFQLGLRGGGDVPIWSTDKNVGSSNKERGKLISDAINKQYQIISKFYHHELYTSSTLWMEGASLLESGDLVLPKDTITVLSDVGMSQLFGDDFFNINREVDRKYGIYYHAAYWHTGPHLTEGVIPQKMKYCYNLANKYNNDYYSILNVANIKEHTFTIFVNRELTWNSKTTLDEIYYKYCMLFHVDERLLTTAIKTYFDGLGDVGEDQYERFCHKYNFSYHKYQDLDFPVVSMNDGMFKSVLYCFYPDERERIKTPKLLEVCCNGIDKMRLAYSLFKEVYYSLPTSYKVGFREHWIYQSLLWCHLYRAGKNLYLASELFKLSKWARTRKLYDASINELKGVINDRNKLYIGKYKTWFNDERKINIRFLIEFLELDYKRNVELYKKRS